jgi:hypothetical protein
MFSIAAWLVEQKLLAPSVEQNLDVVQYALVGI